MSDKQQAVISSGVDALIGRLRDEGVTEGQKRADELVRNAEEKAKAMVELISLTFPVAYGLSIPQMQELGLYISHPRSVEETDRPFAEPGMFAVNAEGKVQLIDISNTPFNRSDLEELVETVEWIQGNNYPIRGTYE